MADDVQGGLGLGALRPDLAGDEQLAELASQPLLPPEYKWQQFASAALKPTNGNFAASFGNAIGALADSTKAEADLRARYLPLMAGAMLQRQQTALLMQQRQTELLKDWDNTLTGAGVSLLSAGPDGKPGMVTPQGLMQVVSSAAQQGRVPMWYAKNWLQGIPGDGPEQLTDFFRKKSVAALEAGPRQQAVTPKVEITNTGGQQVPMNTNPTAAGVGPMAAPGARPVNNTLTPEQQLPEKVDTPQGPAAWNRATGQTGNLGTPAGIAASQNGAGAAPPRDLTQDPARNEADKQSAEHFTKEQSALDGRVATLGEVLNRLESMRELSAKFRGGATADARAWAGTRAKDLLLTFGASQEQADAIGKKLAQGDPAAMEAFNKMAIQGAMEQLKVSMETSGGTQAGRTTQQEFLIFQQKGSPSAKMDPNTVEYLHNFMTKSYQKARVEQEFLGKQRAAGVPFQEIMTNWARESERLGHVKPQRVTNEAMGTRAGGKPTREPFAISNSGRSIKLNPETGNWEYQ